MSTFIELARNVRSKVGMQGTGPASVSVSGAEEDIINAVRDAWVDIQNSRPDWRWMRSRVTFNTAVGIDEYTLADIFTGSYRHKLWRKDTLYVLESGKKKLLRFIDYDRFIYRHNNDTENTPLGEYTIVPESDALLFNSPDAIYPVTIDYQKSPQILDLDADVPELPSYYHLLIEYAATEKYCAAVGSKSIYDQYASQHVEMWGQVTRTHVPKVVLRTRGLA